MDDDMLSFVAVIHIQSGIVGIQDCFHGRVLSTREQNAASLLRRIRARTSRIRAIPMSFGPAPRTAMQTICYVSSVFAPMRPFISLKANGHFFSNLNPEKFRY